MSGLDSAIFTFYIFVGAFHIAVQPDPTTGVDPLTDSEEGQDVLKMSRGVSSVDKLICALYACINLV